MLFVRHGFTVYEYEHMDYKMKNCLIRELMEMEQKDNEITNVKWKLDLSEIINHSYVGSQKGKDNQRGFERWRRQLMRKLGYKEPTFFDTIREQKQRAKLKGEKYKPSVLKGVIN